MPDIEDNARRGAFSRAVALAADRLRNQVDHGRLPWSEHILLVQAGEEEDIEPTEILVKVRAPYTRAVQDHFQRNPLVLDLSAPSPVHAPLEIFPETPETPSFPPPDLDPAHMIGRDFLDAQRELSAAGWLVRAIADGDAVPADLNAGRANIHYRDGGTPQGRTVYRASIG